VPIPVQLVPPLRAHLAVQDAEREAVGATWQDWGLIWCRPDGRPIDTHDDWEEWKALLAEAGITKDARLRRTTPMLTRPAGPVTSTARC
jgi:hypothetical protein